jgi:hypothetical protein
MADVDAHHLRGAVLQQAVGEAAGGLADVQAAQPRDVDAASRKAPSSFSPPRET